MKHLSHLRYLLFLLLFAAFSGCSENDEKQTDPAPKEGYISATIEGTSFDQPAATSEKSVFITTDGAPIQQIVIKNLIVSGQSLELVQATYQKRQGQPEDSYVLVNLAFIRGANRWEYNDKLVGQLSFSLYTGSTGTFSGVRLNAGGTPEGKIESGVFRNVK